jgi:DNA adenine methylase
MPITNCVPPEPPPVSWLERATRFFLLNRYCFNGLYRTNRDGAFNVPYGPARSGKFPTLATFHAHARTLRRARLVCSDFEDLIRANAARGDFFYIDPPYATGRGRAFNEYGPALFTVSDLERLVACLHYIERRNGAFVLSYADCDEARDAFAGWPRYRARTTRNISGFSSNRRRVNELLILSHNHPLANQ